MSVWENYDAIHNTNMRNTRLSREQRMLIRKLPNSLSYHHAVIDGAERDVAIINTDNLDTKFIISLPGEDIAHGSYVEWMDNNWLVIERDANTEVYTKAKMQQCNYLLKWIDEDDQIHEQWCIVEDGTKYLTGEYEDRNFVVTRGDSRIAVTIARNEYTAKLGRTFRFIIDDPGSVQPLAYALTKPLKLGWTFNDQGVFKFVLQEVNTTDDDNLELRIADYYKHFPRDEADVPNAPDESRPGKKVWL